MSCRQQPVRFFLSLLFLAFGVVSNLHAQVAAGTILGAITDTSGASIPNAAVSIKNPATDFVRNVVTNSEGLYRAPDLDPGTYQVSAAAHGFATGVRNSVTLRIGAELVVDMQLRVGVVNETVEIKGDTPSVETSTSTIATVVDARTVRELPLNARDWSALSNLEPGVATVRTQVGAASGFERSNRGFGTQLTVSGNRPQQNNYRLDGISINDYSNGGPGSVLGGNLGVDAIQEFSVVTSNATADYGRTSGGIINAVTRSGTNAFHGSAYEFLRNSVLDASNFFDLKKPPFKRNQFGATAGGPVRKDRTFIFGDYEGLRQTLNVTQRSTVPSQAARNGQLTTGTVQIDPKVQPYLALFPLPNGNANGGDFGTFTFSNPQVTTENFFTIRADNKLSEKDNFYATTMFDDSLTTNPDTYTFVMLESHSKRDLVTMAETHMFTGSVLNSVRFGFSRVISEAPRTIGAINPLAKDTNLGFIPGRTVGLINVSGLTIFPGGLDAPGEFDYHFNSFQVYDDLFVTKGIHSMTIGGNVERIDANQLGQSNPNGNFGFASLRNFLTNRPRSFIAALPGIITPRDLRQTIAAGYFQDGIHWRPNFTLNVGLRYEMATVPTETSNRLSNLRNVTDPQPFLGSPYFSNPTFRNFEPRFGFSWDPFHNGKTAIRGAFGLYDVLPLTYQFDLLSMLSAPFFARGNVVGLSPGVFPTGATSLLNPNRVRFFHIDTPRRNYVMQWNLNVQKQLTRTLTTEVAYVGSRGVHQPLRVDDMNIVLPTSHTSQGYFWPTPAGTGKILNPPLGQISGLFWVNSSSYHAMEVRVTQRMSHGLQFGGSYTWAKSIDTGSSSLAGDAFLNAVSSLPFFDPKLRRGLSDFDIRHNFVLNYTWQIPSPVSFSGFKRGLTNGWQLGGIYQASAGLPFSALVGGDPLGLLSGDTFDFPDRIIAPGCESPINPGNPNHYIKTQCFAAPNPLTRLGNAGRNTIIGPGLSNFDVSIFKNNPVPKISESFNAQFRVEVFNALNHPNFAPPLHNNTLFDQSGNSISTAGVVDSTSTTSRQLQFALKLIW
ncbi:MAG TPA: carboxypeptidase regulatory-like domain-containing protein [Terriglobales bacterium]|jgi:hypothetical protein|nr:carboxypeptidase regulatory-like domain-containing protein [Terriglobales bacterium]